MNSCCENIISLGCFASCEDITIGLNATDTGIWTARVKFNGVVLDYPFLATAGLPITIPNKWPEGLLLNMRLIRPDGTLLDNCYSFQNNITVSI